MSYILSNLWIDAAAGKNQTARDVIEQWEHEVQAVELLVCSFGVAHGCQIAARDGIAIDRSREAIRRLHAHGLI